MPILWVGEIDCAALVDVMTLVMADIVRYGLPLRKAFMILLTSELVILLFKCAGTSSAILRAYHLAGSSIVMSRIEGHKNQLI